VLDCDFLCMYNRQCQSTWLCLGCISRLRPRPGPQRPKQLRLYIVRCVKYWYEMEQRRCGKDSDTDVRVQSTLLAVSMLLLLLLLHGDTQLISDAALDRRASCLFGDALIQLTAVFCRVFQTPRRQYCTTHTRHSQKYTLCLVPISAS